MVKVTEFAFTCYPVSNMERARAFYEGILGLQPSMVHEMPGGQYTNLKEQAAAMGLGARWPEIARTYREVNDLFGDIVKVTPSSKVVGDMALFLFTKGIKPADVVNLPPGTSWPPSPCRRWRRPWRRGAGSRR